MWDLLMEGWNKKRIYEEQINADARQAAQDAGIQNPYQDIDLKRMPISNEFRNTLADYRYMQQLGQQAQNMPNPADYYNPNVPGAQQQLGGIFNGSSLYQGPQNNPYLNAGQGILGQMNYNMPTMPNAPNAPSLGMAPTSYNAPTAPTQGNYDWNGPNVQQFNAGDIGGPAVNAQYNMTGDYGGPTTGIPGFSDLAKLGSQNLGNPNIAREQIGASPLANQAFQSSLAANQQLAGGGGVDPSATLEAIQEQNKALVEQAYRGGAESAAGRGFTDLQGGVAGREIGKQLAPVLAGMSADSQKAIMDAQAQNAQIRAGAAGQLTGLGTAAGQQGLGQGELGVAQRGQDIDVAKMMMSRGNTMSDVANLVNAVGGQNVGAFEAGTARGLGQGQLGLQGQQMGNEAATNAYNAQTNRMTGLGNVYNQGQQNVIGGFEAGTGRGAAQGNIDLGYGNLGLGYGQLGLGYNELGAGNQNAYNQAQNQMYGTQADIFGTQMQGNLGAYNAQTGRYATGLGGAGNMANIYQQGGIAAGQQQLDAGQLAANILGGGANAQQSFNQLQMQANIGDLNAQLAMTELYRTGEIQKYLGRQNAEAQVASGIGQGFGQAAGILYSL